MDHLHKFLQRLNTKLLKRVDAALETLRTGQGLEKLDIAPIKGRKNIYRCRVGDIRIILYRNPSGVFMPIDMDFRGKVYKK